METFITYVLSIAVLAALFVTLVCATRMIKAKDNKAEKQEYTRKTGICFAVYLILNVLRLMAERYFQ